MSWIHSYPSKNSWLLGQDNNERQVPQHLVIYRGFVEDEDYPWLEVELKSLQAVLNVAAKQTREEYLPEITYIAVAKQDRHLGKTDGKLR